MYIWAHQGWKATRDAYLPFEGQGGTAKRAGQAGGAKRGRQGSHGTGTLGVHSCKHACNQMPFHLCASTSICARPGISISAPFVPQHFYLCTKYNTVPNSHSHSQSPRAAAAGCGCVVVAVWLCDCGCGRAGDLVHFGIEVGKQGFRAHWDITSHTLQGLGLNMKAFILFV